jgi:hypothetical protein
MDSQIKYEITLRAPMGEIYLDVSYLSFIRTPLIKNCSYVMLKINLPAFLIQGIINDLNNNIFADYNIEIYSRDESSNNRVTLLFSKLFKILYVNPLEPLTFDKSIYPCKLVLSNPFFHYMSTANTYNKILESKTAYEALKDFEDFIKNSHGDIFKFRHIGTQSELNDYKYEQILIKSSNDLNVPIYIINTYKPFNSFNFYFFDDFHLSEDSDNEITAHYLNIFDRQQFKTFDIKLFGDINGSTKKLKVFPVSDQSLKLDKENESITITNREVKYSTTKSLESKIPKHSKSQLNNENLMIDRSVQVGQFISPVEKQNLEQSSQHINIYAPDNEENAIYRFQNFKEFFIRKLDSIQTYETTNCMPDWCQFGNVYNMDLEDSTSFLYTPINIINIFSRINIKEHYCNHLVRYSMLKFIDEELDASYWKGVAS